MFTLLVHGKTRKKPAEGNHVLEIPPTSQSSRESGAIVNNLERLLTSQEKAAASRPSSWSYWLQGGSPEARGEKKEAGEDRTQNGIIRSLAKMKLSHREDRGIYMHNFTQIKSLCQICDVLWWILILQWVILSDSCWGIKAVIFKKLYVLLDALYK